VDYRIEGRGDSPPGADIPLVRARGAGRASTVRASSIATDWLEGTGYRLRPCDERLSRLAAEGQWWPTVARLRCFRGIDTLTAFVLCLEIGEFATSIAAAWVERA
jgi:hypothetical protein